MREVRGVREGERGERGERGGKELGFAMENRTAFSDFWENALFWFLKKIIPISRKAEKAIRHVPG